MAAVLIIYTAELCLLFISPAPFHEENFGYPAGLVVAC